MASNEQELGVLQSEVDADIETSTKGTGVSSSKATVESAEGEPESLELSEAELKDIAGGHQPPDGGN